MQDAEEVREKEETTPEPPKKKARTIADFFQKASGQDSAKKPEKDSAKKPEKEPDTPKSGNTSGYVRPDSDDEDNGTYAPIMFLEKYQKFM